MDKLKAIGPSMTNLGDVALDLLKDDEERAEDEMLSSEDLNIQLEDYRFSFDVLCEPDLASIKEGIEQEWEKLQVWRKNALEKPSKLLKFFRKAPPEPKPFSIKALQRRKKGNFVDLQEKEINKKEVTKVFMVTDQHPHLRIALYMVRDIVPGKPPRVRMVKTSRFDYCMCFEYPEGLPNYPMKDLKALKELVTRMFWRSVNLVYGVDDYKVKHEAMMEIWKISPPRQFRFPFWVQISTLDDNRSPVDFVKQRIEEVANDVPFDYRPLEWRDSGPTPFDVVDIMKEDFRSGAKKSLEPDDLMQDAKHTETFFFVPKGRPNRDERNDFRRSTRDRAVSAQSKDGDANSEAADAGESTEELDEIDIVIRHYKDSSKIDIMNLRLHDIWEVQQAIDFIAVMRKYMNDNESRYELDDAAKANRNLQKLYALALKLQRDIIKKTLHGTGLIVEERVSEGQVVFLITAPNSIMEARAEKLKLSKLVQPRPDGTFVGGFTASMFKRGGPMQEFWVATEENYYIYEPYFHIPDPYDPACVFTHSERLKLIRHIISANKAEVDDNGYLSLKEGGADLDIGELEGDKIIKTFYPLHDLHTLKHLRNSWARPWKEYPMTWGLRLLNQDLDLLRNYFGEKIAFYFAWLQFYTWWLVLPAVFGFFVFAVESQHLNSSSQFQDRYTENGLLPVFSLFVMLWGTFFLEHWKRRSAFLAYFWNVNNVEERENIRMEFIDKVKATFPEEERVKILRGMLRLPAKSNQSQETQRAFNDASLKRDLNNYNELYYYPSFFRRIKYIISYSTLTTLTVGLFIMLIWVFLGFQFDVDNVQKNVTDENGNTVQENDFRTLMLLGIANGVAIPFFNFLYKKLAVRMNDWEFHRTEKKYDEALVIKIFSFQFVNSFSSLFFLAFWAQNLQALSTRLLSIIVTGQIINNFQELALPGLRKWYQSRKLVTEQSTLAPPTNRIEFELRKANREGAKPTYYMLKDDYLEMMIQYGYVTLFVPAFPLAPLMALLNNILEIRIDAHKLCFLTRRPQSQNADGIGFWLFALEFLSLVAVMTNVGILGVTAGGQDGEPGAFDRLFDCSEGDQDFPCRSHHKVWMMVLIEHLIIVIKLFFRALVSDVPESVVEDRFREDYFLLREDDLYRSDEEEEFDPEEDIDREEDDDANDRANEDAYMDAE